MTYSLQKKREEEWMQECWFCANIESAFYSLVLFIFSTALLAHLLFTLPGLPTDFEMPDDMSSSLSLDRETLMAFVQMAPCLFGQLFYCLIIAKMKFSMRASLLDCYSVATIVLFYGVKFTLTVGAISLAFSILAGLFAKRTKFIFQLIAMGLLVHVQFLHADSLQDTFPSRLVRMAFLASIVRSMALGDELTQLRPGVHLTDLIRSSIGYIFSPSLLQTAPFARFSDWLAVRKEGIKFAWISRGFLTEIPQQSDSESEDELSIRTISFKSFITINVYIALLTMIWYFCFPSSEKLVSLITQQPGDHRDRALIAFAGCLIVLRFNLYFIIFFVVCRLFADTQNLLLLLPTLSPDKNIEIFGPKSRRLNDEWMRLAAWKKLWQTEIEMSCLTPDGTVFVFTTPQTSQVLMFFDRGLYVVTYHYIYKPWLELWDSILARSSADRKRKASRSGIMQTVGSMSGIVLSFAFVLAYFGPHSGKLIWIIGTCVLWAVENKMETDEFKNNFWAKMTRDWQVRLRCMGYSLIQLFQIILLVFFIDANLGYLVFCSICGDPRVFFGSWMYLYCLVSLLTEFNTDSDEDRNS